MASSTPQSNVDFQVKFRRETIAVTLPISLTVGDLKTELETRTQVPRGNQRLLFNVPVVKDLRHDAGDGVCLAQLFPPSTLENLAVAATSGVTQHVKVTAMLIGNASVVPVADSKAMAEVLRLSTRPIEHDGAWYRCSYGRGYLQQVAYVCRTCVNNGRADPSHALCQSCADLCHGHHEVEEWGSRDYMRCDCCTEKCWKRPAEAAGASSGSPSAHGGDSPALSVSRRTGESGKRRRSRSTSPLAPKEKSLESGQTKTQRTEHDSPQSATQASSTLTQVEEDAQPVSTGADAKANATATEGEEPSDAGAAPPPEIGRCMFVIDKKTGQPPESLVLPANSQNRYPRNPLHWCYCEIDNPEQDEEFDGIACTLCESCFWVPHLTELETNAFRRVPCYGDVVEGDTVAFHCRDCNVDVCPPCRLRCHRLHDVAPEALFFPPSVADGSRAAADDGGIFSCGCRDHCTIPEAVSAEDVEDLSSIMPMPRSIATALLQNDTFTDFICAWCMQEYPWLVTGPRGTCYHGELPPKNTDPASIKRVLSCGTGKRSASDTDTFPYHGMLVPSNIFSGGFLCDCPLCHEAFARLAPRATDRATGLVVRLHNECSVCGEPQDGKRTFLCATCEMAMADTFMLCEGCNARRVELCAGASEATPTSAPADASTAPVPAETASSPPAANDADARPYTHPLAHDFMEYTTDNMKALASMQVLQSLDAETLAYVQSNFDNLSVDVSVSDSLTGVLEPVPIEFSKEELQGIAKLNSGGPSGRGSHLESGEPSKTEGSESAGN